MIFKSKFSWLCYPAGSGKINTVLIFVFLAFIFLLANKKIIFGSSSGHWVYPYYSNFRTEQMPMVFIVSLITLLALAVTNRYFAGHEYKIVSLWFILGFLASCVFCSFYPYRFEDIISSPTADSFYGVTLQYRWDYLLAHFNLIQETSPHLLPLHAKTNMVGKIMFYYFLEMFTSSPRVMGFLIILFSNAGGLLVYFVAKALFKNNWAALYALILTLFVPAKIFFFPLLNTVSPVFILWAIFLLIRYLESRHVFYPALLGFSLYMILFFDPLILVMGIFMIFLILKYYGDKRISMPEIGRGFLYVIMVFLACHALVLRLSGYDIFRNFAFIFEYDTGFNARDQRSYGIWILQNLKEFFINSGFIPSILLLAYSVHMVLKWIKNKINTFNGVLRAAMEPGPLALLSFFFVLAALDLSGINRGEVTRLWIFLAVFAQLSVGTICAVKLPKSTFSMVLLSLIVQSSITIGMVSFVVP